MDFNTSYLFTPSNSQVSPPIKTTLDLLPIDQLRWDDFEKLCLRLAQAIHGVNNCEIYGTKGQKQHGIDIFAYKNAKYSSYQCKRYQKVSGNDLEEAVQLFKEGKWYEQSDEFIFCTSCALEVTQIQDKFLELKTVLENDGIVFNKWDKVQISAVLKNYPEIVYDFFGKEWVKIFNSENALQHIITKKKLDALQVIEYRKRLFNIYAVIFQKYDPSIPASNLKNYSIGIQERFILPDFIEKQTFNDYEKNPRQQEQKLQRDFSHNGEIEPQDFQQNQDTPSFIIRESEVRLNPDDYITKFDRVMILGEPGSGKSTLLRYLVLDLLSHEPKLVNTAKQWGILLPIWLPFAFITKKLYENENLNLSELIALWLKSIGEESLFELVDNALQDERLLLIVDGVDEWTNSAIAKHAITKIDIQASIKNTKVVYSSRPYGYRLQKDSFKDVQTYTIAEFSEKQQKQFISYWYQQWMDYQKLVDDNFVKNETNQFILELEQSKDLLRLSTNPLLLSILISHRFEKIILPKNKVKLLENITEHLIKQHPTARRTSANISEEDEYDFDILDIFNVLAKHIHEYHHDGIILKEDACTIISDYFINEMAYDKPRAKKIGQDILNIGANNIGIIIEKSPDEIAFIHRQFQEFMTAKCVIDSDLDIIQETIESYGYDPQWRQVIYFLFGLIPSRKKQEFITYMSFLNGHNKNINYIKVLKYSLSLTLGNAPLDESLRYFNELIQDFEYETDPSRKKALWDILLKSLYNSKISDHVLEYLFKYFPNIYDYKDKRLEALIQLSKEKLTNDIRHFIVTSIINGNEYQKLQASELANQFIDDIWIYEKINTVLTQCYNPEITGYLINTLVSEKVEKLVKEKIVNQYDYSEHPLIYLFVTKLKIHLHLHSVKDLELFVATSKDISYILANEIEQILIEGWGDSVELLGHLEQSLNVHQADAKITHEIAWSILFKCYNHLDKVVDMVIYELECKDYPFSHLHTPARWKTFSESFRDNAKLIPVIEEWLKKTSTHHVIETAYACLVGKTENNKLYLFNQLNESGFSHWQFMALCTGWSEDEEVCSKLKEYLKSDSKHRGYAGAYISQLFSTEIPEGIKIAEEILFDRQLRERNRALSSLIELDKNYFESNILDRFLEQELPLLDKKWGNLYQALYTLIDNFPNDERIKELAFNELSHIPFGLIQYYPETIEKFEKSINTSLPIQEIFRMKLINELSHKYFINNTKVIEQLSNFLSEGDSEVRMVSAAAYFEHIKDRNPDMVLKRSQELVFYVGDDYEVQRQIAFTGYLKLNKLHEYFLLENPDDYYANKPIEERLANPCFEFFDKYKYDNRIANEILIENFDYIYNSVDKNLKKLAFFGYKDSSSSEYWGYLAKISKKDSPTVPYILDHINTLDTISNSNLINFLTRTISDKNQLKQLLIKNLNDTNEEIAINCGRLLGDLYHNDKDVYEIVSQIEDIHMAQGKLMALCQGWSNDDKLISIFNQLVQEQARVNASLAYNLRLTCGNSQRVLDFLEEVLSNYHEFEYQHGFFYHCVIRRLKNDESLKLILKNDLLNTESISKKISYYGLLNEVGEVDEEVIEWKEKTNIHTNVNQFGFDITKNKLISLNEALGDTGYEWLVNN